MLQPQCRASSIVTSAHCRQAVGMARHSIPDPLAGFKSAVILHGCGNISEYLLEGEWMKYKSILVKGRGGLENVEVVERELRLPKAHQARIRILAAPVCQDDIAARRGNRPFLARIPFTPGYAFVGIVDQVGDAITDIHPGDHVAGLTQLGAHAEYVCWDAEKLMAVPQNLDVVRVAPLILNYLVAYQCLHRSVMVHEGDGIVLIGASGGVGTAFLQLGKIAGLKMYGLASQAKHAVLRSHGALPIDYRTQDFVTVVLAAEPGGVDYVFNGMDERFFGRGLAVLRRGGVLVHYGGPESLRGMLILLVKLAWYNLLPYGKKIVGYGTHTVDAELLKKDWAVLFGLLEEGRIDPVIAATLPLTEAAEAYRLLESGQVAGNVVLTGSR
jgi:NADPH:quinone reductase-like Zn-dependent oxidoreductase